MKRPREEKRGRDRRKKDERECPKTNQSGDESLGEGC